MRTRSRRHGENKNTWQFETDQCSGKLFFTWFWFSEIYTIYTKRTITKCTIVCVLKFRFITAHLLLLYIWLVEPIYGDSDE